MNFGATLFNFEISHIPYGLRLLVKTLFAHHTKILLLGQNYLTLLKPDNQ